MKNLFFFSLLFVSIQAFAKPDTDNSFDCLVFHQLDAETKVNCLKELHCVMKPNGKLIIANREAKVDFPHADWERGEIINCFSACQFSSFSSDMLT